MTRPAKPLDILTVNTLIGVGGAAAVALDLTRCFRRLGHRCRIVAGWTVGSTEKVDSLPVGHPVVLAVIGWIVRRFGHRTFVQRRLGMLERWKGHLELPLPMHREFDYAGPSGSRRLLAV